MIMCAVLRVAIATSHSPFFNVRTNIDLICEAGPWLCVQPVVCIGNLVGIAIARVSTLFSHSI